MLFVQASAVLTNPTMWEFYVFRPNSSPPVVYREIPTPTPILVWQDLSKLRDSFMPVIEQLLGIVLAEVEHVHGEQNKHKKAKKES